MVFGGGLDGEREWLDPLMDVAHAATTAQRSTVGSGDRNGPGDDHARASCCNRHGKNSILGCDADAVADD